MEKIKAPEPTERILTAKKKVLVQVQRLRPPTRRPAPPIHRPVISKETSNG